MVIRFEHALDISRHELLGTNGRQLPEKKPSTKILRRLKQIEALPSHQQKILLKTIDTFLKGAQR
jgi:hypothetical protein